jgi:hypothetical protein
MSWDFGNGGSGQGGFGDKFIIPSVREERLFSSNSLQFDLKPIFLQCPFSNILKNSNNKFKFNMNMNYLFNKIDSKIDIFFKMLNKDKMQNIQYI